MACVKGSAHDAELIVSAGADMNAQGEGGYTPLHYAVEQSHDEIVRWLLNKNAKRDITNDNGHTLLDLAELLHNEEMKHILREEPEDQSHVP